MLTNRSASGFFSRVVITVLAALAMSGCVVEEWVDDLVNDSETAAPAEVSVGGSVGDGPVTGATVTVYNARGEVVDTIISDSQAKYEARIKAKGRDYPLRLEAIGGTDLVTGRVPDFKLESVIAHPSIKTANINPFSTLIVQIAEKQPGGLNASNVSSATTMVMEKLSYGLDTNWVSDPVTADINDSNVAHIVKASEAMGEMIRRTRDQIQSTGNPVDGDAIMQALAADLADGVLDGQGSAAADATVTAAAGVVSGQVLVEALSNNLRVDGVIATAILDQSIVSTHPGVKSSELTDSIRVTSGMLQQGRTMVAAARVLDTSASLASIASVIDGLSANATAASVEAVLPADSSLELSAVVGMVPHASPEEIEAVNTVIATGDISGATNTPPAISGTPASSVTAGTTYSFQPNASDADNDTLTFSISNKPSWANFNAVTGRLNGTPGQEGNYGNIVIAVSDGTDTASLPAFSIQVDPAPVVNTPPTINGTPAGSVTAGTNYSFQPTAADADNDTLTFSISNKPAWASFNSGTGTLSGTPTQEGTDGDIVIAVSDGTDTASLPAFSIQVDPAPVVNTPPTIGGAPAGSVVAGESYSFQPTASDADNDTLTFSISGRPVWASFNASTGRLNGTPADSHAGSYGSIVISVSDGTDTVSLPAFSITVDPAPVLNTPPTISGTPSTTVIAGNGYSFQPSAADADNDTLTFSITNKPAWASFNTGTGQLSGTPTQAGTHSNIVISVSDGTESVALPVFSIQVEVANGSFSLSWTAPTTRADGTPISLAEIDGYVVYYGTSQDDYPNSVDITDGSATATTVDNVPVGDYYVVMTTVDTSGMESAQSGAVSKQAQ